MAAVNISMIEITSNERLICSIMMGSFALFGVFTTLFVVLSTLLGSQKLTSFNLICITKCTANLIVLVLYLTWQLPLTITTMAYLSEQVNFAITSFMISTYEMNQKICIVVAVNRFIALFFPVHYKRICGPIPTAMVLVVLIVYHTYAAVARLFGLCHMFYNADYLLLDIAPYSCIDPNQVSYSYLYTAASLGINLPTFGWVIYYYVGYIEKASRKLGRSTEGDKKVQKNIILFVQTVLQDTLFAIDITCLFFVSSLVVDNHILFFVCVSFVGECVHALDSIFMLAFQPQLLRPLFPKRIHIRTLPSTTGAASTQSSRDRSALDS